MNSVPTIPTHPSSCSLLVEEPLIVWRESFRYYASGRNRVYCDVCSSVELNANDLETSKRLRLDLEMAQLRMELFRPHKRLQNELVDEILKEDVRIVIQGSRHEDLFAHKFVLASRSSVFCKMLEQDAGTVCIGDASYDVVKAVIKFFYDGEIEFTDGVTAKDVLEFAHKYGIALLPKICEDNLITTVSCENVPKMLRIARKFKKLSNGRHRSCSKTILTTLLRIVWTKHFSPSLEEWKQESSVFLRGITFRLTDSQTGYKICSSMKGCGD